MALLETGMQPGQQVLKPTDTAALFRQRGTVGTTPVVPQTIQPTPTPTQVPVPQQAATRPVASPAVAAPSPGTSSTTRIPKSSAPVPTPAAPGEQYQHQYKYESPQGDGLLDKSYYEDLGFSTSREKAEELRGTFRDIDTEASALSGDIAQYQTKTDEARTALQKQVDNAWANHATAEFGHFGMVPQDTAEALHTSLSRYYDISVVNVPPAGDSTTLAEYKEANQDTLAAGFKSPTTTRTWNTPPTTRGGPWIRHSQSIPVTDPTKIEEARSAYINKSASESWGLAQEGKTSKYTLRGKTGQSYQSLFSNQTYRLIEQEIFPAISKMKVDYTQSFVDEAQKTFDILDERTLEAQQSTLDLEGQLASVEMDKQAVVDKQAADRAGMAETFNALFRQRN